MIIAKQVQTGRIEDINIEPSYQQKKIGAKLVQTLTKLAWENGCYKTILDCTTKNTQFYLSCGYELKGQYLAAYRTTKPANIV